MLRLLATAPHDLALVNGEIHDWFFEVEDIRLDRDRSEVVIPFRRWATDEARIVGQSGRRGPPWLVRLIGERPATHWEAPWYRWFLRVHQALDCDLVDEPEIGFADFNKIGYDREASRVTIEGNIPVNITIPVRGLEISVEETDEIIGLARYTTYPSGDSYTGAVLPLRQTG